MRTSAVVLALVKVKVNPTLMLLWHFQLVFEYPAIHDVQYVDEPWQVWQGEVQAMQAPWVASLAIV